MSDKPDNQSPGAKNSGNEEIEGPVEPEQIWPPPEKAEKSPSEPDAETADQSWPEDVEKIDEAIEEIRHINGKVREELPGAVGVSEPAPEASGSAEEMLAGKVGAKPAPLVASSSEITCRVREKSQGELGQLWGSVFFSAEHAPPRAIVVTAARRRDGATQIATSLALIGAEASQERHVALVDFNVRNPGIADLLDIKSEPGLTDVLDGRATLDAAMHALEMPNGNHLYILPSGPVAEQPLGLLKSRQAQSLIARLQERYDHTIFDVTAANAHPDPQVIGSQVDGALLVVRAGETPRETVAEAKRRLDLAGVRCLGLVLNQRSDPVPALLYRMT